MIFAAGLGTRLKPITDTRPKALVEINGHTLLETVIAKLKTAGFERLVVNVHHFSAMIIDYLKANNNFGIDIRVSDETEMLLDTGGGIRKARPLFDHDSPVLIHNVDIVSNADILQLYDGIGDNDALLLMSKRETSGRYLLCDDNDCLRGWTNIKTGEVKPQGITTEGLNKCAFNGIHVLAPQLLDTMDPWPDKFSIIDFYLSSCNKYKIKAAVQEGLKIIDVGKIDSLERARELIEI